MDTSGNSHDPTKKVFCGESTASSASFTTIVATMMTMLKMTNVSTSRVVHRFAVAEAALSPCVFATFDAIAHAPFPSNAANRQRVVNPR